MEKEQGTAEVDQSQHTTGGSLPSLSAVSNAPVSEYVCDRFSHPNSHIGNDDTWWKCRGDADAIDFKVDRDLSIVGVGVYPARKSVPWKASVALLDKDGPAVASVDATFNGDGTTQIKTVRFPKPVQVLAGETYTIKADITSPSEQSKYNPFKTHYGENGRKIVKVQIANGDVQFVFSKSAISTNNTEPGYGQIPHILFTV